MPAWVSEGSVRKYNRAVAQLTKEKLPVTEEAVKELYQKWGGLVLGDANTVLGVEEGAEEIAVERSQAADEEKDVPRKRGKK